MKQLAFDRPLIMGIVNVTPDSFSDGGNYSNPEQALTHARKLISEGADILDIGAESTFGPEAQISAEQEWDRLEPLLNQLDYNSNVVSVDTTKAEVAQKALQLGVQMINDVTALRGDPDMIEVLLDHNPYVCLMYSADETPYASRKAHHYEDVMQTVKDFLQQQSSLLLDRGFPQDRIIVDPGLGFFLSADAAVSWEVIDQLDELRDLGFPILIGPSMKSFLGGEIADRLPATLEASKKCLKNGASIVRVHHVLEHREALGL